MQEWLAAGFGVVLLGAMFLHWYGSSGSARTAWEAFSALDVLLAVVGLAAVGVAASAATQRAQAVPTALAAVLLPLAVVATGFVVYRAASPPHPSEVVLGGPRATGHVPSGVNSRDIGLWIGLVACAGIVGAAFAVIRDQSFPRTLRESGRVQVETLPTPPREGAGQAGS